MVSLSPTEKFHRAQRSLVAAASPQLLATFPQEEVHEYWGTVWCQLERNFDPGQYNTEQQRGLEAETSETPQTDDINRPGELGSQNKTVPYY